MTKGVAILRVSSTKQGLQGDSPEDQKKQVELKAQQFGILSEEIKFFKLIQSASGEIQPATQIIEYCKANRLVKFCFIKSIDRFTRAGAEWYAPLKRELEKLEVQLIDVYGVISQQKINTLAHLNMKYKWSEYSPSYTTELLEAERAKSEVRDILSRMIGAEIRYIRMGYWVGPAPLGFTTEKIQTSFDGKRTILVAHPEFARYFARMFEMRAKGNITDDDIVEKINKMGYKSPIKHRRNKEKNPVGIIGGKQLTKKQLWTYIKNPIYAGVIVHNFAKYKPVKAKFEGLISIETWNAAQRGKQTIVIEGDTVLIRRKLPESWQLSKQKQNPEFPYKEFVLCPECKHPLKGSFSRGKLGKYYGAYHCSQ